MPAKCGFECGVDREGNKRIDIARVRGNERRLIVVRESYKTEDVVSRARYEGGRSGERDDAGTRRWEEEWTAEEKVDGGDTGGNRDGPGGAERSDEEPESVEVADHDSR